MKLLNRPRIPFFPVWRALLAAALVWGATPLWAAPATCEVAVSPAAPGTVYVLGDSIGYGLFKDGLADKLRERFGSEVRISFDVGRSITTPGSQINQTALQSVEADAAYISRADTIVIVLGSNQMEASFANSQQLLLWQLKALAPNARYYWVDIGGTLANQVAAWSVRNRVIYDNAPLLGYEVISRYRAIFGAEADPLNLSAGRNFPYMNTEPGFGVEGNLHGADPALSAAILQALQPKPATAAGVKPNNAACKAGF